MKAFFFQNIFKCIFATLVVVVGAVPGADEAVFGGWLGPLLWRGGRRRVEVPVVVQNGGPHRTPRLRATHLVYHLPTTHNTHT